MCNKIDKKITNEIFNGLRVTNYRFQLVIKTDK